MGRTVYLHTLIPYIDPMGIGVDVFNPFTTRICSSKGDKTHWGGASRINTSTPQPTPLSAAPLEKEDLGIFIMPAVVDTPTGIGTKTEILLITYCRIWQQTIVWEGLLLSVCFLEGFLSFLNGLGYDEFKTSSFEGFITKRT